MRVQIPVIVYVSTHANGRVFEDVLAPEVPEDRALASMVVRERRNGLVTVWRSHPGVVSYDDSKAA